MKKACQATQDLFKNYLREQIMEIIDAEKVQYQICTVLIVVHCETTKTNTNSIFTILLSQSVKHSRLADMVEEALQNKKYVSGLDNSQLDMCYPAIIQSGGQYALKFSVVR